MTNSTRHLQCRQTPLCQVFSIGHSANTLPRAETDARRKKVTRWHGDGHGAFAECQLPDTQQTCILCRVPNPRHSAKLPYFTVCQLPGTWQSVLLCRVSTPRHSAKIPPFAVCQTPRHSAKFSSLPSVKSETLDKGWPRRY